MARAGVSATVIAGSLPAGHIGAWRRLFFAVILSDVVPLSVFGMDLVKYSVHSAICRGDKKSMNIKNSNTMNIKPLADRVLVLPAPAEEKTVGGIIIPDSAKEKPLKGTVVAVGNGTKDEEMVVKPNDMVLYGKYAGTEIELDGEKYLIMRQSDILAIL